MVRKNDRNNPYSGMQNHYQGYSTRKTFSRPQRCLVAALLLACVWLLRVYKYQYYLVPLSQSQQKSNSVKHFQKCSIDNFLSTGLPFLDSASPLSVSEFVQRRNNLANALVADQIDAFVVEPGYTFQYYANISQKDWEIWEPEERPFLMVVRPSINSTTGVIKSKTTFLAPSFELERVRLLGMPFVEELEIIPWEEHWNPYETLRKSWKSGSPESTLGNDPKVMVDEEMRDFIQRGLGYSGFDVIGLGREVERVRQTKSPAEIEIVRAVNTGTVEAVRAMRKCMYAKLTENEITEVLDNTLRAAGLEPFFNIVLFDEDASNPHGGTNGTKALEATTLVLIDVGAHLYGYSSDITRTFFPPFFHSTVPSPAALPNIIHKQHVYSIVYNAQSACISSLIPNNTAAAPDIAARNVIASAGYGPYFTHRVGHGIGIKAHESPYLNKGNIGVRLREGMVFTCEPGVYLEGKFGVREEDVLLVKRDGEAECLSGRRSGGPFDP
ncbi:aminopeptidase-like protein P [Tricladium varicosporioides]|nr:aminopeptidase-like protein P [Hymenoscyphus varicosporioides]